MQGSVSRSDIKIEGGAQDFNEASSWYHNES